MERQKIDQDAQKFNSNHHVSIEIFGRLRCMKCMYNVSVKYLLAQAVLKQEFRAHSIDYSDII